MPETLDQWLEHQQRQHVRSVALGLDRVRTVWEALGAPRPAPLVITVGGTNGKGSVVAYLQAMLRARNLKVGAYTSPHLVRYNERVTVDAQEASDRALCDAFARIECARGMVPLTYFEYGTLAALLLFAESLVDIALLEVGLGGRLDAVNIIDADAAIVTTIGIDHVDYLGPDRDSIGREKAGIARRGRPLVLGSRDMPIGLLSAARAAGAEIAQIGTDFDVFLRSGKLIWDVIPPLHSFAMESPIREPVALDRLPIAGQRQYDNVASALAALWALRERLGWNSRAYALGLQQAQLKGRLQSLGGRPEVIVDVAHNPQAAGELAAWLDAQTHRTTHAVFSALADKDIAGIAAAIGTRIDHWHVCGILDAGARGSDAAHVAATLRSVLPQAIISEHLNVSSALAGARKVATDAARILAFGSFHVAGTVLRG